MRANKKEGISQQSHLRAFANHGTGCCLHRAAALVAAVFVCGTSASRAGLSAYDAAIAADAAAGFAPVATLTTPVVLTGTGGSAFDFGPASGDVTIEFILEGDPAAGAASAYLAVGEEPSSSLRYEQCCDTARLGFTRLTIADYLFSPSIPSPGKATHVTYVWNATDFTMSLYVNGVLAGTAGGVSDTFVMPSGQGWLGATAAGLEAMVGTIHRVTVYDDIEAEDAIFRHAQTLKQELNPALEAYDTVITADADSGLTAVASLTSPTILTGGGGVPFDFSATADDVTFEFILEGDPIATGQSGFLAVGANTGSSLRYEQWNSTKQLGFTQSGVLDYMFSPAVPSPVNPSHLAYVWNATDLTMTVYLNGVLVGTATGVTPSFAMPNGAGYLGSNPSSGETMAGTIYRLNVYDDALSVETILRHAEAFTSVLRPPIISSFVATPAEILGQGSSKLTWEVKNAIAVFLDGVDVTAITNTTVSPLFTTTYTLLASNELGVTSTKLTITVNPLLDAYDAAIKADETGGLTPVVTLTNTVTLTGLGGVPFDFGATTDDVTIEFILEGDPVATGASGYLAIGTNPDSSLRYDQNPDTAQIGFTQLRVADYKFFPEVPSPTLPTHLAFVWNATELSMKVYVNGTLGGTVNNVSSSFVMPAGAGFLGSNPGGGEAMVGRIFRIVVYDDVIPETTIKTHATAFTSIQRPPIIESFVANPSEIIGQGSTKLSWVVKNATGVTLNQADVTTVTNVTVSPRLMTTYTLTATNALSSVSSKVIVTVIPKLETYDAVIAADETAGITPVARLTTGITLDGSGGVPFDFGANADDVTMEFIVEGDHKATGASGYLAVGPENTSTLRYDQWNNTGQLGITRIGVADYVFTPTVPSPWYPTHVTFVWSATELSMKVYINGVRAGTVANVDSSFAMPTGVGTLGANPGGGEAIVGRIHRVFVYDDALSDEVIFKHGNAFMAGANPALNAYDTAIITDVAGGLEPVAHLNTPTILTGSGGTPFNFGANADDVTIEFILEGDSTATGASGFLAVGSNTGSSLRYEQWNNTAQLGFTLGGVADYLFTPALSSPTQITHLTYAWDAANATMTAYINGAVAGTVTGVGANFGMPTGQGWLGATAAGLEAMVGTIYRVIVYDQLESAEVIQRHANALISRLQGPSLAVEVAGTTATVVLSQGISGGHYRLEYRNTLAPGDTWQLLQDIPALNGTTARVADPTAITGRTQRFYRAVAVQ